MPTKGKQKNRPKPNSEKDGKNRKWRKGHSCASNPSIKKHRLAAKGSSTVTFSAGQSALTSDLLDKHNASYDARSMESDQMSDGGHSYQSLTSSIASNCTNVTFKSVIKRITMSQSVVNSEILAVLAATAEQIDTKDGLQSDSEYFAALMSLIKCKETLTVPQKTAVLYLVSVCIKRIPPSLLLSHSEEILKTLLDMFDKDCDNHSLMKSILACLSQTLRIQDQFSWKSVISRQAYNSILSATVTSKPKIRKSAQHAIGAILRGSTFMTNERAPLYHPMANDTANYCNKILENFRDSNNTTSVLHVLGFLNDILSAFSKTGIKSTCENILRLLMLPNVLLKTVALKTLHCLFNMSSANSENLTAELNDQIIKALYDYIPSDVDVTGMLGWLAVMEKAYCNLNSLDKTRLTHVVRLFEVLMKMIQSHPSASVFDTLSALGNLCPSALKQHLRALVAIHSVKDYQHKDLIEKTIGSAVRSLGPKAVLDTITLNITGDSESDGNFPRSWLIPVLRDYIQETEMSFFVDYFLPLANKIKATREELKEQNNKSRYLTYTVLQSQIWSLLPGFCTKPTDLTQSFPKVAETLGKAIIHEADVRMDILSALRKLVNQNIENENEKATLSRFAKNFLAIFCNLYTSKKDKDPKKGGKSEKKDSSDSTRLSVLETFKCYLKITSEELINEYIKKCYQKIIDPKQTSGKHELMDLLIGLVPYANEEWLNTLQSFIYEHLKSTDATFQKKSYRLLEEICSCKSVAAKNFVLLHLHELQSQLIQSLSKSNPSSKTPRLRCLTHILHQLEVPQMDFLSVLLPEAVLCTKATNERARSASFALLVEMCQTYLSWFSDKSQQDSLQEFLILLIPGLMGNSPHVISCTVLAISKVLYDFKEFVSSDLLSILVENACSLLQANSREVVQSALGLVKVFLSAYCDAIVGRFLQKLLSSLGMMKDDCRLHFRNKIKDILTKLLRKCGCDVLMSVLPAVYQKLLKSVMKKEKRKKSNEEENESDAENDERRKNKKRNTESIDEMLDDLDIEETDDEEISDKQQQQNKQKNKSRMKKGGVWLKEEGNIIDFLDVSAAQKVMASVPKVKEVNSSKGFDVASDGRMIIVEKENDDKKKTSDVDELKNRKRRRNDEDDEKKSCHGDSHFDDNRSTMSYQSGGRGIHRPIKKRKTMEQNVPGNEYKSKKSGGDVRRKNREEPYAYIPMDTSLLNRRKRAKASVPFRKRIKAAIKGSKKGKK